MRFIKQSNSGYQHVKGSNLGARDELMSRERLMARKFISCSCY